MAVFPRGGENVNFLTQMRTKCVLKYQKSTHCVPNVNFADLFGTTAVGASWSPFGRSTGNDVSGH